MWLATAFSRAEDFVNWVSSFAPQTKPQDVADYTQHQRQQSGNIQELEQTFQDQEGASRAKAEKDRARAAKKKKW